MNRHKRDSTQHKYFWKAQKKRRLSSGNLTGGGVEGGVGSGGGVRGGEETGESPNSGRSQSSVLALRSDIATELTKDNLRGVVDGDQ